MTFPLRRLGIAAAGLLLLLTASLPALDLAGEWSLAPGGEQWPPAAPPASTPSWAPVAIPNPGWHHSEHDHDREALGKLGWVWLRREVTLDAEQATRDVALVYESIRWGFRCWVNGHAVGGDELYAPGSLSVPAALWRPGNNEILLAVRSYRALPRGGRNDFFPLMPVGSARMSWGKSDAAIAGAIELDFFDQTRVRQVLVLPEPDLAAVSIRPLFDGFAEPASGDLLRWRVTDPAGLAIAEGELDGERFADGMAVALSEAARWSPDDPRLLSIEAELIAADGSLRDTWHGTFGLRHLTVVAGDFRLNGEHYPLLGSNVVHDWLRNPQWFHDVDGRLSAFYLDAATGMNARVLRTHTLPPIARVGEICDRGGMLLLAEMPTTYNGTDYGFDAEEEEAYRRQALAMQQRWIVALANHPSIVGWVVTNEPTMGDPRGLLTWQQEVLEPAARGLDPSREVLQAADTSQTISDIHNYSGFWGGAAGDFMDRLDAHVANAGTRYALFNSEYIEGIWGREYRWAGPDQDHAEVWRIYAQIGHEQTDAMRVRRYDGILPYWLAAWTWEHDGEPYRPWAPLRMYAALRSSLSPCYAVVDRFDRQVAPAAALRVPVHLINDARGECSARVRLYLLAEDPGHDPAEPNRLGATAIATVEQTLAAGAEYRHEATVTAPADAGIYHLAAVTEIDGEAVAISQRILRVVDAEVPPELSEARIRVLGASPELVAGLRTLGLDAQPYLPLNRVEADLVVIWEDAELDPHSETFGPWLNAWLHDGGSLVILAQPTWPDRGWGHVPRDPATEAALTWTPTPSRHSTVHEVAAPLRVGLDRRHFLRWNGHAGVTTRANFSATLFGESPARITTVGPVPHQPAARLIGDAAVVAHDFVVTEPHPPLTPRAAVGPQPRVPFLEQGHALLLNTGEAPGPAGYRARWVIELDEPFVGHLWSFEHPRRVASPFAWRIGDGPWREVGGDWPSTGHTRLGEARLWFAWCDLGAVELSAGRHEIEFRVTEAIASGTYHLAVDTLLLAPALRTTVLARDGVAEPVVVETPLGAGRLTLCQLSVRDRVLPDAPHADPAVRQFLFNLLAHAARPRAR